MDMQVIIMYLAVPGALEGKAPTCTVPGILTNATIIPKTIRWASAKAIC